MIFLLSITVFLSFVHSKAQLQDSNLTSLLAINESAFINKPLDSIISALPSGYQKMVIYGTRRTARKLTIKYPNEVWIELHVRQFSHMNPVDQNKVWNTSQMRQENLFRTVIYQNNRCYRNCNVR